MENQTQDARKELSLSEARAECYRRVKDSYAVMEINVDARYRTSSSYVYCIVNVLDSMVREGLIHQDMKGAVRDQHFG